MLGSMMGTPDYIAPEQASDAHSVDIRADIYSLGCTFYCLLAGRAPFHEGTVFDKIRAHSEQEATPLAAIRNDVPAEVESIVRKMMAKDPNDRYQTPQEVVDALTKLIDARIDERLRRHGIGEPPIPPKPRTVGDADRRPIGTALIVGLACLALAIAVGVAIYISTNEGMLIIETDDRKVEIAIDQNGKRIRVLGDERSNDPIRVKLRVGEYELKIIDSANEMELSENKVVIRRGDKQIVHARYAAKGKPASADPNTPSQFFQSLGDLQAIVRKTLDDEGLRLMQIDAPSDAPTSGPRRELYLKAEVLGEQERQGKIFSALTDKLRKLAKTSDAFISSVSNSGQGPIDRYHMSYTTPSREGTIQLERAKLRADKRMPAIWTWTVIVRVEEWPTAEIMGSIDRDVPRESDWAPLFNGSDLTGWKPHPDMPGNWRVENGVLIGDDDTLKIDANTFLMTERNDYKSFHLRLEARVRSASADSGVNFDYTGKWDHFTEVNITFDPKKLVRQTGSVKVYGSDTDWIRTPADMASSNEWFTLEVIARDTHIVTKVNGRVAAESHNRKPGSQGHILLQQRGGQTAVEFRKIEIIELDEHGKPLHQDQSVAKESAGTPAAGKVRDHLASLIAVASDGIQDDELKSWIKAQSPSLVGQKPQLAKMALEWLARLTDSERQQLLRDGYLKWKSDQLDPSRLKTLESMIQLHLYGQSGMDPASSKPLIATNAKAVARQLDKLEVGFAVIPIPRSEPKEGFISWYVAPRETGFVSMNFPLVGVTPDLVMQPGGIGDLQTLQTRAIKSIQRKPFNSTPESIAEDLPLVAAMPGHTGAILDLAWSRDGKWIASASSDHIVHVWDADTHKIVATYPHREQIAAVAFSPDSRLLVTGTVDAEITLRELENGAGKKGGTNTTLEKELLRLHDLAFSPDGEYLLCCGSGGSNQRKFVAYRNTGRWDGKMSIQYEDTTPLRKLVVWPGVPGFVTAVSDRGEAVTWNYIEGKGRPEDDHAPANLDYKTGVAIGLLGDGHLQIVGNAAGELLVRDDRGTEKERRIELPMAVYCLAVVPGGKYVIAGGSERGGKDGITTTASALALVEIASGRFSLLPEAKEHIGVIRSIEISPDGRRLVTSAGWQYSPVRWLQTNDYALRMWQVPKAAMPPGSYIELASRLEGHSGAVDGLAWHPDGKRAVSYSGHAGEVRIWNTETGETLWTARTGASSEGLGAAAISADGTLVAIGGHDGEIHLIAEDGTLKGSWKSHDSGITSIAFSSDGAWLAAVSTKDSPAKVWEVATKKPISTRDDGPDANAVTFTGDGLYMLTGGRSFMTRRIQVDSKGLKGFSGTGSGGDVPVHSVAATQDGTLVAYGESDGSIILRQRTGSVETHNISYFSVNNWSTRQLHQGPVTALAFTADGRYLISGGLPDPKLRPELAYSSLIVWDVATREPVVQQRSKTNIFQRLAVSSDGRTLLTASSTAADRDHRLHVWRLPESVWPSNPSPSR
jgi:WD40 repeat protein